MKAGESDLELVAQSHTSKLTPRSWITAPRS
jgi:hypothetical protein